MSNGKVNHAGKILYTINDRGNQKTILEHANVKIATLKMKMNIANHGLNLDTVPRNL